MQESIFQNGNTVRLSCSFYDFDGTLKDPNIVKIKFYGNNMNLINEFTNVQRVDIGKFYYDYIIENTNKNIRHYYEWYAEIDGVPSLKRSSFITRFI